MLAGNYTKSPHLVKWINGVVVQPKLDGVRALIGNNFLKSRGNKYYANLEHIKNEMTMLRNKTEMSKNILFDCELYSEDITGICRKQKNLTDDEKQKELQIHASIFDLYDMENPNLSFKKDGNC